MALRQNIEIDQIVTALQGGKLRQDLNEKVRAITHDEVAVAMTAEGFTPSTLQALRVLDRSPQIGAILVKGRKPFMVFRKEVFESVSGFDLNGDPEKIFETLYERIKLARQWTTLLSLK